MAERTANIQLKLSSGAFTGEIKRTEQKVAASGKRMGREIGRQLDAGFKKGQRAIASVGKSMGRMVKQAATIGGAFATAALLKDSVEINKQYQDISFLLSKVPGQLMSWQQIQALVQGAAEKTTQSSSSMADAFSLVYQATGDLEYAKDILESIGVAATASGKPVEQIAKVADMVRRKWGLTGKAAEEAMAKFIEKSDKGGLSLDQLSSRVDYVAGTAAAAGLSVTELLGTVEQLDNVMGEMAPRGLKSILEYLKDGTTQAQQLEKAGRFKLDPDLNALDRLEQIIKNPKAHKAALKIFTETSRTAFDELRKPFVETLKASKAAGDTDKVAREKAAAAYDAMVVDIRKTELTSADIRKSFADRKETDPSVKMREALEKVRNAFAQPKMIEAIGKLADKLPALADAVADLVSWIMDNPLGAAGLGMGLRAGVPMMAGMFGRGGMGGGGGIPTGGASSGTPSGSMSGRSSYGALGGYQKAGKASGKAATNINRMGTSAMGVAGALVGAGSLGYALGQITASFIDAESDIIDATAGRREKATGTYLEATRSGATVEDKISAIKDARKQRGIETKGISASPVETVRQIGELIGGDRKITEFGVDKEAFKQRTKNQIRMTELSNQTVAEIYNRRENELSAAKSAEESAAAWANAAKSSKELVKALGLKASSGKPGTQSRGKRNLNNEPGSEPTSG